jgi:hypothetical protein
VSRPIQFVPKRYAYRVTTDNKEMVVTNLIIMTLNYES